MSNSKTTRRPIGGHDPRTPAPPSTSPMTGSPPAGPRGQNPALLLAAALSAALEGQPWQPACARCVAKAKASGDDRTALKVPQALTWQDGEPVCYGCYRVDGTVPSA